MSEYVGIVITFVLAGALVGAFILLASTLGPKMPSAVKSLPSATITTTRREA